MTFVYNHWPMPLLVKVFSQQADSLHVFFDMPYHWCGNIHTSIVSKLQIALKCKDFLTQEYFLVTEFHNTFRFSIVFNFEIVFDFLYFISFIDEISVVETHVWRTKV